MSNTNQSRYRIRNSSKPEVPFFPKLQRMHNVRGFDMGRFRGLTKNLILLLFTLSILIGCAGTDKEKIQTIFYPMPPQTPKIQFLTSITKEDDVGKKRDAFKEFLIGKSQVLKEIARPFGMSSEKGKIYVSDRTYKKILIIDLENKEFDYIRTEKTSALDENGGIWITEDGYKYVSDFGRKQVVVLDDKNKFIRAYGEKDQFIQPIGVAVHEDRVYVCDGGHNKIFVLDKKTGKVIDTFGELGKEKGMLYKPSHITLDKMGNLYVTDAFNFRIQKFAPDGEVLQEFGYQGDTLGGFARPKGVAVDPDGHLYAVDTAFENVQIFDDESAKLLLYFGEYGPAPGSMYMPSSIYIDDKNIDYFKQYVDKDFEVKYLIFVGNMLGQHKLNVYGFGDWIGDPLPGLPDKPATVQQDDKK